MTPFWTFFTLALAMGNLGMSLWHWGCVRNLKARSEPQGIYGPPATVNFTAYRFGRCEYQELKPGHCYLFILRGHWRFVGCVGNVGKDGCFYVLVPSPADEFRAAFSMGGYGSEAKINWYRDVTGCEEVTV